jgi:nitroimidazol reductase NimA-like FMN-containing flavoprotein (pyridoxamine 5'-phosphate oxidase superfamily)
MPVDRVHGVTFEPLSHSDSLDVLRRNHVGRIAYSFADRVDIEPLHYALDEGDGLVLCLRTSPGSKVAKLKHNQWAAFEVDEIEGPFAWRSVVAHGSVYPVDDLEGGERAELRARTIAAIRRAYPAAFASDDPASFRTTLLRFYVDVVTGRSARPSPHIGDTATAG